MCDSFPERGRVSALNRVITSRMRSAYRTNLLLVFSGEHRARPLSLVSARSLCIIRLIFFCLYRDCPGVGTSSGPAGKEVSYHGNVGGTSVGYKPPPQHSPQTRGPPPHFPQEPVGPPANSPPLHINICGQVRAHRYGLSPPFVPLNKYVSPALPLSSRRENYLIFACLDFQENTMRGPILNMSPGLGPSGVDMEYRRNAQGTSDGPYIHSVGYAVPTSSARICKRY
jgi:hypothetical protein